MMQFKTPRLTVRPLCDSDKVKMLEMLYDEHIKRTYMIPDFKSPADAERLFDTFVRLSHAADRYVGGICLDDRLIGFINDTEIEKDRIELGYVIALEYQNKGFCTEALQGTVKYLFEQGFSEVICGAFEENAASIRVMQKCDMSILKKTDVIEYRGTSHRCVYYSIKKS